MTYCMYLKKVVRQQWLRPPSDPPAMRVDDIKQTSSLYTGCVTNKLIFIVLQVFG